MYVVFLWHVFVQASASSSWRRSSKSRRSFWLWSNSSRQRTAPLPEQGSWCSFGQSTYWRSSGWTGQWLPAPWPTAAPMSPSRFRASLAWCESGAYRTWSTWRSSTPSAYRCPLASRRTQEPATLSLKFGKLWNAWANPRRPRRGVDYFYTILPNIYPNIYITPVSYMTVILPNMYYHTSTCVIYSVGVGLPFYRIYVYLTSTWIIYSVEIGLPFYRIYIYHTSTCIIYSVDVVPASFRPLLGVSVCDRDIYSIIQQEVKV